MARSDLDQTGNIEHPDSSYAVQYRTHRNDHGTANNGEPVFQFETRTDLFSDGGRMREGIALALAPFLPTLPAKEPVPLSPASPPTLPAAVE